MQDDVFIFCCITFLNSTSGPMTICCNSTNRPKFFLWLSYSFFAAAQVWWRDDAVDVVVKLKIRCKMMCWCCPYIVPEWMRTLDWNCCSLNQIKTVSLYTRLRLSHFWWISYSFFAAVEVWWRDDAVDVVVKLKWCKFAVVKSEKRFFFEFNRVWLHWWPCFMSVCIETRS